MAIAKKQNKTKQKTEQTPCGKTKGYAYIPQRASEVMKNIALGLDKGSSCEKSHIVKELVFKLNKRE